MSAEEEGWGLLVDQVEEADVDGLRLALGGRQDRP